MDSHSELARAHALLREGKLPEAEAACCQVLGRLPKNAVATHLLGLIRKDAGDDVDGERLLAQSIELDPRNADYRANLANLQRRLGRLPEAERNYRDAIALDPLHRPARVGLVKALTGLRQFAAAEAECRTLIAGNQSDPQAWNLLAKTLRDQGRFTEAEAAYRKSILADPRHAAAHHNLGSLLVQMERAEEALATLERAQSLGLSGFELAFNRGRTLAQLYRIDEAEQAFAEAVAHNPRHAEAQLNLARLRFMRGDAGFARAVAAAADADRDDVALQLLFAAVMRRAGDNQGAERILRELLLRKGPSPDARSALAQVLFESGRLREAEFEAVEAATLKPEDAAVIETLVAILLSRGFADEALTFIDVQRRQTPNEQGWIAYEATAARLLGRPLYRDLYDYRRFVRTYELEPPSGWASMADLNADLLKALNDRHCFANHPLDQSLRNGTQTVRSLLCDPHPAIQAVIRAFEAPIRSYLQTIGTEPGHPLTARNRGSAILSGAWSVQLRREGFHVNHVHPQGWISSAYYVAVPAEVHDLDLMSGWIKFGETRFPVPGATPETFVKPHPGRLVLFPSYMWHGTNPIHGPDSRTAIAFDAVPYPESGPPS